MSAFPMLKSQYKLLHKISDGAYSEVHMARCVSNNKVVAIKIVDLDSIEEINLEEGKLSKRTQKAKKNKNSSSSISELRRKLSFWLNINHPNVIRYYGSFFVDSNLWIISELVDCGSVGDALKTLSISSSTSLFENNENNGDDDSDKINATSTDVLNKKKKMVTDEAGKKDKKRKIHTKHRIYKGEMKGFKDEVLIASILKYVLEFLMYFHKQSHIYQNVCPKNIFISSNGEVKLNSSLRKVTTLIENGQKIKSFKLSSDPFLVTTETKNNCIDFTSHASNFESGVKYIDHDFVKYCAPEILDNSKFVTDGFNEKADIWSVGITAIELATGRNPFHNIKRDKIVHYIEKNGSLSLLSSVLTDKSNRFSQTFIDFISSCIKVSPGKRPSARQLLAHKFIKMASGKKYINSVLTAQLSPLSQRFEMSATTGNHRFHHHHHHLNQEFNQESNQDNQTANQIEQVVDQQIFGGNHLKLLRKNTISGSTLTKRMSCNDIFSFDTGSTNDNNSSYNFSLAQNDDNDNNHNDNNHNDDNDNDSNSSNNISIINNINNSSNDICISNSIKNTNNRCEYNNIIEEDSNSNSNSSNDSRSANSLGICAAVITDNSSSSSSSSSLVTSSIQIQHEKIQQMRKNQILEEDNTSKSADGINNGSTMTASNNNEGVCGIGINEFSKETLQTSVSSSCLMRATGRIGRFTFSPGSASYLDIPHTESYAQCPVLFNREIPAEGMT